MDERMWRMTDSFVRYGVVLTLAACLGACSSSTTSGGGTAAPDGGVKTAKADGGGKAQPATKAKKGELRATAKNKTPPAGATSKGKQSSPTVDGVTVPISDVEVYELEEDIDGDGTEDAVYWARDDQKGATFVWASTAATCEDGSTDGTAAFIVEVKDDGTGTWLVGADGCEGAGVLMGCDFDADGNDTTCGTCVVDEEGYECSVKGS